MRPASRPPCPVPTIAAGVNSGSVYAAQVISPANSSYNTQKTGQHVPLMSIATLLCRRTCPCKSGAQTGQLVSVLILGTRLAEIQRQQSTESSRVCLACCRQARTRTGTPCGFGSSVLLQNLRKFNPPEPGDG